MLILPSHQLAKRGRWRGESVNNIHDFCANEAIWFLSTHPKPSFRPSWPSQVLGIFVAVHGMARRGPSVGAKWCSKLLCLIGALSLVFVVGMAYGVVVLNHLSWTASKSLPRSSPTTNVYPYAYVTHL